MIPNNLKNSELFIECIKALEGNVTILSLEESNKILDEFENKAPFHKHGARIDWSKVINKERIEFPDRIITTLNRLLEKQINTSVYLFWNDAGLPVIKTDLKSIIESYDDIVSLGFETWMYNPQEGYVVENYYLGEIHIGII
jgi:hypothetical protein